LVDLAATTTTRVVAVKAAAALRDLFEQFTEVYELRADERAFLQDRIDAAATAAPVFPLVFQHGDPGTWNLLANDAGQVVFLDWEAAEPTGMPLWDLFYFMRSFAVGCGRKRGVRDSLAAIGGEMLSDAPIGRMLANAVQRYRERTGLHAALVEPLFHTCWMHRALKEATRLNRDRLARGHYLAMLRLGIARRETPAMRRLFAG
ncbi:MAG: phosphotransferase family protein, partial [bacterium]